VTSNPPIPHTYQIARNVLYVCNTVLYTRGSLNSCFVIWGVIIVVLLRLYSYSGNICFIFDHIQIEYVH
jgi:hypothetical protein